MRLRVCAGALAALLIAPVCFPQTNPKKPKKPPADAANGARPTLRIQKSVVFKFEDYKKVNPGIYDADGKLKINDINAAWRDVSDVVISGTLTVNRPDPNTLANEIFVVNKLTLDNDARIILNGNAFTIFANVVVSNNNAAVVSYGPDNAKKPPSPDQPGQGANGSATGAAGSQGPSAQAGEQGDGGGTLIIFANAFEGPLMVNLNGQGGGDGGHGGSGGSGATGVKGGDGEQDYSFFGVATSCRHDGDNGGPGGAAGQGGPGGAAGRGGTGGVFNFLYVTSKTVSNTNPQVSVSGGQPGMPGQGGNPGSPGAGGLGGSGQGFCHGGNQGPSGAKASAGPVGQTDPTFKGTNGSYRVIQLSAFAKIQEAFKQAAETKPLVHGVF